MSLGIPFKISLGVSDEFLFHFTKLLKKFKNFFKKRNLMEVLEYFHKDCINDLQELHSELLHEYRKKPQVIYGR